MMEGMNKLDYDDSPYILPKGHKFLDMGLDNVDLYTLHLEHIQSLWDTLAYIVAVLQQMRSDMNILLDHCVLYTGYLDRKVLVRKGLFLAVLCVNIWLVTSLHRAVKSMISHLHRVYIVWKDFLSCLEDMYILVCDSVCCRWQLYHMFQGRDQFIYI